MIQILNQLLHLGIEPHFSLADRKRVKLLNQVVLIFIGITSIKLVGELVDRDAFGIPLVLSIMTLFGITLIFQTKKMYAVAKWYLPLMMLFSFFALSIMYGRNFGGSFGFITLTVWVTINFKRYSFQIIWFALIIISYAVSEVFLYNNPPLYIENLSKSAFHFMFIGNGMAVLMMSFFYIKENREFEERTNELLASLKEKNNELSVNQKEIAAQNQKLETANKELEKFAYVASHDLKTPLRNVNSFLGLIKRKLASDPNNEVHEYLDFATANAQQMYDLIQDILEYSRMNKGVIVYKEHQLNDILKKVVFNLQSTLNEKKAQVNIGKLPTITCNEGQMILLLQNLIENGIKYNTSSIPTISIRHTKTKENHLITIQDNGIGIEEEYKDKIFEMFSRLHNQGEYQGSGIGLAICKKIAQYNGGDIWFESVVNEGTCFFIQFPLVNQMTDKTVMTQEFYQ